MTEQARRVLADCRTALYMLEQETNLHCWRIHWVAALALIRAVGHVLEKVDGADPKIKRAANAAFQRWKGTAPEHEIFREFIERERNSILKQYQFNYDPVDEVNVAIKGILKPLSGGPPVETHDIIPIRDNIYRPLIDSYREGDDARDVLSEAIVWWEAELTAIDEVASSKPA